MAVHKQQQKVSLPPPSSGAVDVLFIAGEHSGDQHAARLARELLQRAPDLKIAALGGPALRRAGAQLVFDLTESSVVGLVEVLKNYGFFKSLFEEVIRWIKVNRPKAICFVDYPGFNLRLAEKLHKEGLSRKAGGDVALFYYISPQIWAWKPKRRFKMARILDGLAVIFPFELDSYRDTDLPVRFVGHPFVAEDYSPPVHFDPDGRVLLLPGSRVQPVNRIFPAMLDGFEALLKDSPDERAVAIYPEAPIREILERHLAGRSAETRSAIDVVQAGSPVGAKACLISSGTMSLACALAGIPGAICYRAHPLTYFIGRRVVKVRYLGIANLLLPDAPPYPEYIQDEGTPEALAKRLKAAINDPAVREQNAAAAESLSSALSPEGAQDAALWLLDLIGRPA